MTEDEIDVMFEIDEELPRIVELDSSGESEMEFEEDDGSDYEDKPSAKRMKPNQPDKAAGTKARQGYTFPVFETERSYFLEMPVEVMDLILADKVLKLADHVALSRVSKRFRAAYMHSDRSSSLWLSLFAVRRGIINAKALRALGWNLRVNASDMEKYEETVAKICSIAAPGHEFFKIIKTRSGRKSHIQTYKGNTPEDYAHVLTYLDNARIPLSTVKSTYKLSVKDLQDVTYTTKHNHYGRAPVKLYRECEVERLAFSLHGGSDGLQRYKDKLKVQAAKANATREKNGTKREPKRRGRSY